MLYYNKQCRYYSEGSWLGGWKRPPPSMMGHGLDFYHGAGSQPCIYMMYVNGCVDEFISFYFFLCQNIKRKKQNTILMPEDYWFF